MHNDAHRLPPGFREQWSSLIALARLDMDEIVEKFLQGTVTLPSYRGGLMEMSRLKADAYRIFDVLLDALAGDGDLQPQIVAAAQRIGEERGAIGVALPDLRTALRSDFFILWDYLTARIQEDDHEMTIHLAPYLLRTIESFIAEVERGYERSTDDRLARRLVRERQLLPLLFNGVALGDDQLRVIARAMTSSVDDRYLVCASSVDHQEALDDFEIALRVRGRPGLSHWTGTHLLLLVPASPQNLETLESFQSLRVGVSEPIERLQDTPRAARLAIDVDAHRLSSEQGQLRYQHVWQRIAAKRIHAMAPEFFGRIHARLSTIGSAERETLRETIVAVAESATIADASGRLYCHRNTVQNRLSRVTQLTGMDASTPKWLFLLYLYALTGAPAPQPVR